MRGLFWLIPAFVFGAGLYAYAASPAAIPQPQTADTVEALDAAPRAAKNSNAELQKELERFQASGFLENPQFQKVQTAILSEIDSPVEDFSDEFLFEWKFVGVSSEANRVRAHFINPQTDEKRSLSRRQTLDGWLLNTISATRTELTRGTRKKTLHLFRPEPDELP